MDSNVFAQSVESVPVHFSITAVEELVVIFLCTCEYVFEVTEICLIIMKGDGALMCVVITPSIRNI
jgi:hypothetical protein